MKLFYMCSSFYFPSRLQARGCDTLRIRSKSMEMSRLFLVEGVRVQNDRGGGGTFSIMKSENFSTGHKIESLFLVFAATDRNRFAQTFISFDCTYDYVFIISVQS